MCTHLKTTVPTYVADSKPAGAAVQFNGVGFGVSTRRYLVLALGITSHGKVILFWTNFPPPSPPPRGKSADTPVGKFRKGNILNTRNEKGDRGQKGTLNTYKTCIIVKNE